MSGYLLDTNVFLWHSAKEVRVPQALREKIANSGLPICLGCLSGWEMAKKIGLGKLEMHISLEELLGSSMEVNGLTMLEMTADDCIRNARLPFPSPSHRDPLRPHAYRSGSNPRLHNCDRGSCATSLRRAARTRLSRSNMAKLDAA